MLTCMEDSYTVGSTSSKGVDSLLIGRYGYVMNPTDAKIAEAVGQAIGNANATIRGVAKATEIPRRQLNRKIAGKARRGFAFDDIYSICRYIGVRIPEIFKAAGL